MVTCVQRPPHMVNAFPQFYKSQVLKAIETIDLEKVAQVIEILRQAREEGRRIFVCGNGGSASAASHFVCDMVKGASYGRASRFRIMALTDSLPTITAYSNDVGYECVFVEQLKNFAEPGDVAARHRERSPAAGRRSASRTCSSTRPNCGIKSGSGIASRTVRKGRWSGR